MAIELFRIDDRLIHGQVVVGWGQPLDVPFIVLVDDDVAASDWEQELYRMGVPPDMTVTFESVDSAAAQLRGYESDPRRGILLTGDIDTMRRFAAAAGVRTVNVGGIHYKPGRVQRLRYVFLAPEEERTLTEMEASGVVVTAQDVPAAKPIPLREVLASHGGRGDVPVPDLLDLLPIALLGAVLGLDVVSFPQAMISRPIAAATIAGAFVGDAAAGLLVGALLELVAIETLPFGASRYPEWGSASVVAGVLAAQRPGAASLAFAVTAGLLVAWGAGVTMVWLRRLNARLARARQPALESGSGRTVVGLQLLGMTADLVRGLVVTLLALLVLVPLGGLVARRWVAAEAPSLAVVVAAATAVTAAAAWKLFHAVPHARTLFIGGLVAGSVVLLLR